MSTSKNTQPPQNSPVQTDAPTTLIRLAFKPSLTQHQRTTLLTPQFQSRLNRLAWRIKPQNLSQYKQLLFHMHWTTCEVIVICECSLVNLTILTPPAYLNLKLLQLSRNELTSLECLTFLNMDHIQKIYLIKNLISNMKSLSKTKWSQLKLLDLSWNHIEGGELTKFKTGSQVIELAFDMNPLGGRQLGFFVKLQASTVRNLEEATTHKIFNIRQEGIKTTVLRKYYQNIRNRPNPFGCFWVCNQ